MTEPTTWRDLADELHDWQRVELGHREPYYPADELLDLARDFASMNLTEMLHPNVPPPPHASETYGWTEGDQGWQREWVGPTVSVGPARVVLGGHQRPDGSTTAAVTVISSDAHPLTANQARQLADTIREAANQADATNT